MLLWNPLCTLGGSSWMPRRLMVVDAMAKWNIASVEFWRSKIGTKSEIGNRLKNSRLVNFPNFFTDVRHQPNKTKNTSGGYWDIPSTLQHLSCTVLCASCSLYPIFHVRIQAQCLLVILNVHCYICPLVKLGRWYRIYFYHLILELRL